MNKRVMSFAVAGNVLLASIFAPLQGMMQDLNASDIQNFSANNIFYLMYLTMGKGSTGQLIGDSYVMKSGAQSQWYNRVCTVGQDLSSQDIDDALKYIDGAQFGWWVSADQPDVENALKGKGLVTDLSEPAMIVDLTTYEPEACELNKKLVFKKIDIGEEKDLNEWVATSAAGFQIDIETQQAFVNFIKNNADMLACSFYLGLLNETPVSSGLMIEHKTTKIASLHLVSTIEQYRKQGMATMLSNVAMMQAKRNGCTHMILLSSPMAHPLYQDLGFKDYKGYAVYTLQKDLVQDDLVQDDLVQKGLVQDPSGTPSWCWVM